MINGFIFKKGGAEELANDEYVRNLYLGEKFKLYRY
jgi:lipopolysaccharide export system ATP-binding protein